MDRVEALAEAWASMDGNLDKFRAGKGLSVADQPGGHFSGYIADAEAMIERLEARGFTVVNARNQQHGLR
jgi:hypothetical protein